MSALKMLYYISGHGYGHAVRSIEVINVLLDLGCSLWIKTAAPFFIFKERLSSPVAFRVERLDAGLHQLDNLRFDLPKTKAQVKEILAMAPQWIEQEHRFLIEGGFAGVVCDIPFIPFAAAEKAGIPAIGISNFSWDWIYSFYQEKDKEWSPLAEAIATYYRKGDLLLRLPFHGPMKAFRNTEDIPLVAARSKREKEEIRKSLHLPADRKIALIGFSRADLSKEAVNKIEKLSSEYLFVIRPPLDWNAPVFRKIEGREAPFVDLVQAADLVITKPGYGIVAECLAHDTPMIYSDRGEFPEYPILVEGIETYLPCCHMPKEDLYEGNWRPYLERIEPRSFKPEIRMDGAQVAGRRILEWFEGIRIRF